MSMHISARPGEIAERERPGSDDHNSAGYTVVKTKRLRFYGMAAQFSFSGSDDFNFEILDDEDLPFA